MTDLRISSTPDPAKEVGRDAAKAALATTGLMAALGAAACCALPVALGALGIGSAALFGVAMLVGPYQRYVMIAAIVCLTAAAYIVWRQSRARACGVAGPCARPALDWISRIAIVMALGLLALTLWIEPPI